MTDYQRSWMWERERPQRTIHTIYVPPGWSPEQAWEHIRRSHATPEIDGGSWCNVEVYGGKPRADGFWEGGRLVSVLTP